MKIRKKKTNTSIMHEVTIPLEHLKYLGWKSGDDLVCISEKKSNTITFKKKTFTNAGSIECCIEDIKYLIDKYGGEMTLEDALTYENNTTNSK